LAEAEREIKFSRLHLIEEDEEIYQRLLPLFGIGRWTVEMFLIFQLGRVDIWPTGDLGVRRGWEKVHRMRSEISPKDLEIKGERFRPYRSHLAWYCWRALEQK
jgi:DNA-3-methyladenine glycosylase II